MPHSPRFQSLMSSTASLSELDERAREVFRQIVETYLETGEPVGSRTLSRTGVHLSPASIRNTMQDLSALGLLSAPHISAGRLPTHQGLRLFVDGLLEIGDLSEQAKQDIEARLTAKGRTFDAALHEAGNLLSGLAGGAGLVMTPVFESGVKHVEFISLGADQALAVIVYDDGRVENRLMPLAPGTTPSVLTEASNYLNARLKGRSLGEERSILKAELDTERMRLDEAAAALIEAGLAVWSGGDQGKRALIVRGRSNLLEGAETLEDLERVRSLFDDLEQKEELIDLLDDVMDAQGVRIFIGAESKLFSLSGSAVIAAPYMMRESRSGGPRVVGAIGVIGPTRLNYARIIPLVDYTAKLLGRLLD
jgi:heat-inducible transcriptional repressor